MIHLLEVTSDMTPPQLKKLSRRYAMTGGYEIALKGNQSQSDLEKLVEIYGPELANYSRSDARFRTNNAYRILYLIYNVDCASSELKDKISIILGI